MTGYVIITQSRFDSDEYQFMADRNKTQTRFWTLFIDEAFVFISEKAAKQKASCFKHGNPKVITLDKAREISDQNSKKYSKPNNNNN